MRTDRLACRGRLTLTYINDPTLRAPVCAEELADRVRRGHAGRILTTSNLVVDLGLSILRALVGNGASTPTVTNGVQSYGVSTIDDLAITTMKFGNLASPAAPTAADYQLADGTVLYTATPVVTYPSSKVVVWSGLIPANTHTGDYVTEEGLFAANGALFARTTFTPWSIVLGQGVQADHEFTFAAS